MRGSAIRAVEVRPCPCLGYNTSLLREAFVLAGQFSGHREIHPRRLDHRRSAASTGFHTEDFGLTTDDMCGLQLYGLRCVRPGGLDVGVDGGVDDAAGAWLSAREEDEFCLVEDALGLNFRYVRHFSDPIHRSATGIKIIRIIFCGYAA